MFVRQCLLMYTSAYTYTNLNDTAVWYTSEYTYTNLNGTCAIWPMLMIYVVIGPINVWWRCHYVTHDYNDKQKKIYIESLRL